MQKTGRLHKSDRITSVVPVRLHFKKIVVSVFIQHFRHFIYFKPKKKNTVNPQNSLRFRKIPVVN